MTHPHEGLQERALREAAITAVAKIEMDREGYPLSRTQQEIYDDAAEMVDAVFALSTPPVQDQGLRDALARAALRFDMAAQDAKERAPVYRKWAEDARTALSTLPQQAATDEGEAFARVDDPSEAVWNEWTTPTPHPPAAETRLAGDGLDHLTDDQWQDMLDAGQEALCQIRSITYFDDEEQEAIFRAMFAALTQPEPTAQQACPAPTPDDETYYTKGKDAPWFEALSDKDFAEQISHAAMDLNDTGLGDDLDKWMPFQAMMSDAGSRITRLLSAQQATDCPDCDGTGYRQASTAHKGGECPTCAATGDRLAQQAAGEAEAVRPAVPSKNGFLSFWYENYRGELSERVAIPIRIYHGATEWHPEPQWLLEAWDMEKDAVRAFAMSDMQAPPQPTETVSAGDFYADLYARSCALIGVLRTALKPFAGIKADDGDNFDGYPNDVVIRVETTAGELKNARAAMGDTVLVSEALAPQPPETQRIVASLLYELILLAHQYRSDLIYPLADDSRERRIAAIDAVLAKTGEK